MLGGARHDVGVGGDGRLHLGVGELQRRAVGVDEQHLLNAGDGVHAQALQGALQAGRSGTGRRAAGCSRPLFEAHTAIDACEGPGAGLPQQSVQRKRGRAARPNAGWVAGTPIQRPSWAAALNPACYHRHSGCLHCTDAQRPSDTGLAQPRPHDLSCPRAPSSCLRQTVCWSCSRTGGRHPVGDAVHPQRLPPARYAAPSKDAARGRKPAHLQPLVVGGGGLVDRLLLPARQHGIDTSCFAGPCNAAGRRWHGILSTAFRCKPARLLPAHRYGSRVQPVATHEPAKGARSQALQVCISSANWLTGCGTHRRTVPLPPVRTTPAIFWRRSTFICNMQHGGRIASFSTTGPAPKGAPAPAARCCRQHQGATLGARTGLHGMKAASRCRCALYKLRAALPLSLRLHPLLCWPAERPSGQSAGCSEAPNRR